jgi:DNA polymerase I
MTAPRLFLIDGHALAYRAFYAIPNLTSPDGTPTGAVLGFLRKVMCVVREAKPDGLIVVFDGHGPTFRDELSKDYKATRSPMPDELRSQLAAIVDLIPRLGIKVITADGGAEADDVIASLAIEAAERGTDVEILSGDKDLAALVRERTKSTGAVTLLAPSRDLDTERRLDPAGVTEKFGVPPALIPDLLSLMGDSSDNIPGVAGVGAKTAAKLLNDHGSIDGVLKALESLTPKLRKSFEENAEALALSRKLVALRTDPGFLPPDAPASIPARLAPEPAAIETLRKLGFKSLTEEMRALGAAQAAAAPSRSSETSTPIEVGDERPKVRILDEKSLPEYLARLAAAPIAAVDTETTSLNTREAALIGASFAAQGIEPAFLPISHAEASAGKKSLAVLKRYLEDDKAKKCGHNIKYDLQVLRGAGIESKGFVADTMVVAALLDPLRRSNALDALALEFFGLSMISFESLGDDLRKTPLAALAQYAGEDAWLTARFHVTLSERLNAPGAAGLRKFYDEIEHPLIFVLTDMEWEGITIDSKRLEKMAAELRGEIEALKERASAEAGEEFNMDSPKQVGAILYEKLALPAKRKTKTGWSTDQEALEELAPLHPLPAILLEHREVAKLLNTYVVALPEMVSRVSGRIHAQFSQARTATGRLSSQNPNLQNIPIRTERGRRIREAFVAPEGRVFVSADYSQVEFRIAAHLSGDERLLAAFREGRDLHAATAEALFGHGPLFVESKKEASRAAEERRLAKAVNFGILYGQSAFGLARTLGISRKEADGMIKAYFEAYPRLKSWMTELVEKARETGYVETLFGRRRPVPELKSANHNIRTGAERIAVNSPVQGSAADAIKIAMIRLHERLSTHEGSVILLQVHDELLLETPEGSAKEIEGLVRDEMLRVPVIGHLLEVNTGIGRTWLEAGH